MKTTLTLVAVLIGLSSSFAQTEWNKEVPASPNDPGNTPAIKIIRRTYNLAGIGVIIKKKELEFVIVEVLNPSGAQEAGLKSGDVVTHVDGKDIHPLQLQEITALIRGNPGTTVTLKVERPGQKNPLELKVTRHAITLPNSGGKVDSKEQAPAR